MSTILPDLARPQMGEDADKAGAYAAVVRLGRSSVNPGELLEGDLFVTGYGQIDKAKLAFYPAADLVDTGGSTIRFGLEKLANTYSWGGQEASFEEHGLVISLTGGLRFPGAEHPNLFFDMRADRLPQIVTETSQVRPPVTFRLKLRKDATPGQHTLHFILTYFDGFEWQSAPSQVSFTVRNILQRHEGLAALLATLAAVVAIAPALPWLWAKGALVVGWLASLVNQ